MANEYKCTKCKEKFSTLAAYMLHPCAKQGLVTKQPKPTSKNS